MRVASLAVVARRTQATLATKWGKPRVVKKYSPGDFFGEGALLGGAGAP